MNAAPADTILRVDDLQEPGSSWVRGSRSRSMASLPRVGAAKRWPSSANRARASRSRACRSCACIPPPGRIVGGQILDRSDGEALTGALPDAAMRAVRGHEIAMIFQEPMTSLNPVMTIGDQIAEMLRPAPARDRAARRAARARRHARSWSSIPPPRSAPRRLPAPDVRRHAPARDDRAWRSPAARTC